MCLLYCWRSPKTLVLLEISWECGWFDPCVRLLEISWEVEMACQGQWVTSCNLILKIFEGISTFSKETSTSIINICEPLIEGDRSKL